jgi:hypothetical protein
LISIPGWRQMLRFHNVTFTQLKHPSEDLGGVCRAYVWTCENQV